jgi:hypothetical protein
MEYLDYLHPLIDFLLGCPRAKDQGKEILMRCPHCGDPKSEKSRNYSIRINVKKGQPIPYKCFRAECQAKGIITPQYLQKRFNCYDLSVLDALTKHNKGLSISKKSYYIKNKDVRTINRMRELNEKKLNYINKRLGVKMDFAMLKEYKINLSITDTVKFNEIKINPKFKKMIAYTDYHSISFLSIFGDYLICRYIDGDKRYHIQPLNEDEETESTKIYTIPTKIDRMDPKPTVLHLAEGPLSILGAHLHCKDLLKKNRNNVYSANCGSTYYNTIAIVCSNFSIVKADIVIYSDSEIKVDFYKELYSRIKDNVIVNSFIVVYNTIKEDFGYPEKYINYIIETIV